MSFVILSLRGVRRTRSAKYTEEGGGAFGLTVSARDRVELFGTMLSVGHWIVLSTVLRPSPIARI